MGIVSGGSVQKPMKRISEVMADIDNELKREGRMLYQGEEMALCPEFEHSEPQITKTNLAYAVLKNEQTRFAIAQQRSKQRKRPQSAKSAAPRHSAPPGKSR
jgi:hypothetical protein